MRFLSQIRAKMDGFTLIEVLIIAPIVIIAISGFIALIITMVGDVLATRDRNAMTFEIRDSLDRIEQDTRLSTQFLTTTVNIQAPQGSNDDTTPFSNTNSLVLGTLSTDKNPVDSSRQLIFYAKQPNDCGALESYNRPLIGKSIYFIKNGSLWRRSYLPPYNTTNPANDETVCTTPWQLNSCSPGYVSSRCQTNDLELLRNITAFNVKYYATPQSTTDIGAANALTAQSIEVTLTGEKSIAGRSITQSGSVRVAKLNNIDADLPIPNAPSITSQTGPNSATFSWDAVPAATSYLVRYNIDGGAWTETTLSGSTNTNYTIPGTLYRNQTATIEVRAKNSSGTSPIGTTAASISSWVACDLQGGWQNYVTDGYATAGFTKTNNEVVYLKGLIKWGTASAGTVVCTLPEGYRPTKNLVFLTGSNGGVGGVGTPNRIDVRSNGEIVIEGAAINNGWLSLEPIRFVSSNATYTRTNLTPLLASWQNFGDPYSSLQTIVDSTGRVHTQGLIRFGTWTDWTHVATFPAGQQPSHIMTLPTTSNTVFNQYSIRNNNQLAARGINGAGYWSIQSTHYPSSFGSWTNLPLSASWIAFDAANFSPPSYTKSADGIVTVRGTIKNGTNSQGTTIAQLPAGYRPKERQLFTVNGGGSWGRVDITPDGYLILQVGSTGFLSLDSISFIAEQ